jgi:hypothetical protein
MRKSAQTTNSRQTTIRLALTTRAIPLSSATRS